MLPAVRKSTAHPLQVDTAPEPGVEPSIGGFESIRTELSGAMTDAGRAAVCDGLPSLCGCSADYTSWTRC